MALLLQQPENGKIVFPNVRSWASNKPYFIGSIIRTYVETSYQYIFTGQNSANSSVGGFILTCPSSVSGEIRFFSVHDSTSYSFGSGEGIMNAQGLTGNWSFIGSQYFGDSSIASNLYGVRFKNSKVGDVVGGSLTTPFGAISDDTGSVVIGGRTYDQLRNFWGWIEYVAAWEDCVLTEEEVWALCDGASPFRIRPQNLVFAPILIDPDNIIDTVSGRKGQKLGGVYRARGPGISY